MAKSLLILTVIIITGGILSADSPVRPAASQPSARSLATDVSVPTRSHLR